MLVPIHEAGSSQFNLERFTRNAEVHAALVLTTIAAFAVPPPQMILLDEAERASWGQTCVLLFALVGLFSFKRHTSHFRKHVWLVSIRISALE